LTRSSTLAHPSFLAGGGVIATVDVTDFERLSAHADNVRVVSIQP